MTKALDRQLRQLLLRQLAPEDVARMEEAILMEDGVAERLREEEFDLIDDYVQGRLSTAERADMERYVLTTPERMASLRVARALAAQRPVAAAEPVRSAPRAHWKSNRMLPVATLLAAGIAGVALIPQRQRRSTVPCRRLAAAHSRPKRRHRFRASRCLRIRLAADRGRLCAWHPVCWQ